MKNAIQQTSFSRYVYLFIIVMAILQGGVLYAATDYTLRNYIGLPAPVVYLPMLLAIFVPSVSSYLVTSLKSALFYLCLVCAALLIVWINFWYGGEAKSESEANPFTAIVMLTLLFFFLLPWLQLRLSTGVGNPDYLSLINSYIRNAVLGVLACVIGGIVAGIIKLAGFLFGIVNLTYLSEIFDNALIYWVGFCLGFNISLVFMRSAFDFQAGKIAGYVARVLLPVLNIIAVIFIAGLIFSAGTGARIGGLDSFTMLWFLILNIILLNLVYGAGAEPFRFRSWLNHFVLFSIVLLNIFSVLSLYGIFARVNQYSWSMSRLYAFTLALFLAAIVLAYSIAVLCRRSSWAGSLGTINKTGILVLIAGILVISSPLADFNRISVNSLMAAIGDGKIKIDSDLKYRLESLGHRGEAALATLKASPQYSTELERSPYEQRETITLKEILLIAKNSPALPDSWWAGNPDFPESWYCKEQNTESECLGFMADVNKDGEDDVVACYYEPLRTSFSCYVWQRITVVTEEGTEMDEWRQVDSQESESMSSELRQTNWNKLKEGRFLLKTKEWQQIDVQE